MKKYKTINVILLIVSITAMIIAKMFIVYSSSEKKIQHMVKEAESNVSTPSPNMFSDCYAYSVLNDDEKIIYNKFYETVIQHKKDFVIKQTGDKIVQKVYYAINADHPEIFWTKGYKQTRYQRQNKVANAIKVSPEYAMTKKEIVEYQQKIEDNLYLFLTDIKINASDYEKAKYVYETLGKRIEYVDGDIPNSQNMISAIVNKKSQCKGYASAAQYLFKKLGIQSCMITGNSKINGVSHAWNIVKLDGQWYQFDATWGDAFYNCNDGKKDVRREYINYDYLNVTTKEISKDHEIEKYFDMPECNSTDDNYYIKEGLYVTNLNDKTQAHIRTKLANVFYMDDRGYICFKFKNKKQYNKFIYEFLSSKRSMNFYCKGLLDWEYLADESKLTYLVHFTSGHSAFKTGSEKKK